MAKRAGWVSILAYVPFALMVTLFVGLLVVYAVSRKNYEATIAQLRLEGKPTCIGDLNWPRFPESENAAVVYDEVFKNIYGQDVGLVVGSIIGESTKPASPAPETWGRAESMLRSRQSVFPRLETALSRPHCRFADYAVPPADDGGLEYGRFRKLARFLSFAAQVDAHNGRMDRSYYDLELLFRVAQHTNDKELLVGQMARMSLLAIGSRALAEIINCGVLSEDQFRRLDGMLASVDLRSGYLQSLKNERAYNISYCQWFMSQCSIFSPIWYAEANAVLHGMNNEIAVAQTAKSARELANFKSPELSRERIMANILAPTVWAREEMVSVMSELAIDRVLLALAACHRRYGAYPATLAELQSKLNWKAPKDECSGKDLIYKRVGKGYKLYSIGLDLKDDGGMRINYHSRRKAANGAWAGDIVVERK